MGCRISLGIVNPGLKCDADSAPCLNLCRDAPFQMEVAPVPRTEFHLFFLFVITDSEHLPPLHIRGECRIDRAGGECEAEKKSPNGKQQFHFLSPVYS